MVMAVIIVSSKNLQISTEVIVNVSDFNAIQTDYIYGTQVLENASEVTNKFFR